MPAPLLRRFAAIACLLLSSLLPPAWAGDHGGAAAPGPITLVVNLNSGSGADRFLKLDLVLESAAPEIDHEIGTYMPRILHRIILLLSGEKEEGLRTLAGKHDLADKIRRAVNKILHEDEESGVKEVLFTNFLIQ